MAHDFKLKMIAIISSLEMMPIIRQREKNASCWFRIVPTTNATKLSAQNLDKIAWVDTVFLNFIKLIRYVLISKSNSRMIAGRWGLIDEK